MPRLDLFRELHPSLGIDADDSIERDPGSARDPEVRCYRSGFWATIPIEPRARPGEIELRAEARLAGGETVGAALGRIEVVEPPDPPAYDVLPESGDPGLIAVCMATYDPDVELFRTQIDSLRAQTDSHWVCLISDDGSEPERFEAIAEVVGDDPRFVVSRSESHLGFYRNFERALGMIPGQAELVALCDQDDRWYPDKLEVLRRALGDAQLAYSDTRLVDPHGRILSETLWRGRRNNHTNFASMAIANTVPGAASLLRREVVEVALPFPEAPGDLFHDHWLALVAFATGELRYIDRPLYDYVQHTQAVQGKMVLEGDASSGDASSDARGWLGRPLRALRQVFAGWRPAYFHGYLPLKLQSEVLRSRCSERLTPRKRRALALLIASERSVLALAWLASRPARALLGRNETLGVEQLLVKGILWRHIVAIRSRGRAAPGGSRHDASLPLRGSFDQKRLRRWRALR